MHLPVPFMFTERFAGPHVVSPVSSAVVSGIQLTNWLNIADWGIRVKTFLLPRGRSAVQARCGQPLTFAFRRASLPAVRKSRPGHSDRP